MTFFALAENKNGNSLFLDSDQDGITDQEEQMLGTDPANSDTDGDGYSDGKEVKSGYNPLKPAPGDKLVGTQTSTTNTMTESSSISDSNREQQDRAANSSDLLLQLAQGNNIPADTLMDLSSDPDNPNLTNEAIGQLLQQTLNKAGSSDTFAENPTYSAEDLSQISKNALEAVDISKNLPDIKDEELDILPPVEGKKLTEDEIKEKQKEEIEKYLAQTAFVFASNAPFPVDNPSKLESQLGTESTNFFSALTTGDKKRIDSYATKARTGIDQLKKVPTPYILRDIQKSMVQLAIYTLDQKENISFNPSDPMKSLAATSSLQAVAQNAMSVGNQLSQILANYGITEINFP